MATSNETAEADASAPVEAATSAEETPSAETNVVPDESEPIAQAQGADGAGAGFVAWPVEKNHGSARRMLLAEAEKTDISVKRAGGGLINVILALLIVGATGAGIWQLTIVSSAEALEAKRQEREAVEKAHMEEMLKKQKNMVCCELRVCPTKRSSSKTMKRSWSQKHSPQHQPQARLRQHPLLMALRQPMVLRLRPLPLPTHPRVARTEQARRR